MERRVRLEGVLLFDEFDPDAGPRGLRRRELGRCSTCGRGRGEDEVRSDGRTDGEGSCGEASGHHDIVSSRSSSRTRESARRWNPNVS